ncbi:MerR family transcriptional regulator [Kitasatospora sp. MBT66]|uniref:MerR family transcriptional regulator n=1 Tax=Kitasatospora sp. MBT66 TaxID=1444769 RepID=UPI0005BE21EF|nr:MerR family transcriptional regulator [Kitasatospora sp. MBT66]
MRIGELAARTGVSVRLLRYYEEQGLLEPRRPAGGQRRYDEDAPAVVRNIRALLGAGLSTSAIRDVLPCVNGDGAVAACMLEVLEQRLDLIDTQMLALGASRVAPAGIVAAARQETGTAAEPVPA